MHTSDTPLVSPPVAGEEKHSATPKADAVRLIDPHAGERSEVVGILRELLAEAEAGEVRGVVLLVERDRGMALQWSGARDLVARIGAIELLKGSIIANAGEDG